MLVPVPVPVPVVYTHGMDLLALASASLSSGVTPIECELVEARHIPLWGVDIFRLMRTRRGGCAQRSQHWPKVPHAGGSMRTLDLCSTSLCAQSGVCVYAGWAVHADPTYGICMFAVRTGTGTRPHMRGCIEPGARTVRDPAPTWRGTSSELERAACSCVLLLAKRGTDIPTRVSRLPPRTWFLFLVVVPGDAGVCGHCGDLTADTYS